MTDNFVVPTTPQRHDPIRLRYYRSVEIAECVIRILFWAAAVLSFAVLLMDHSNFLYDGVHVAFVIAVISLFVLSIALRLYWMPSAADARCVDLISNAYQISLTHEITVNYYNNNETDPIRRLGAAIMENSFFSNRISKAMLRTVRAKVVSYLVLLAIAWTYRCTDYGILEAFAQIVFSEYLLSHWLRLEWFRSRTGKSFSNLSSLFLANPVKLTLHAQILEYFAFYESTKANAGITLLDQVFLKLNDSLSSEWESIKSSRGL